MNANFPATRTLCLVAGLALACSGSPLRAAAKSAEADAFPRFESYVKITGQKANVTGSESAYARRFQQPADGSYGIEALHYAGDISKDSNFEFNGRALSGAEDYLGQLKFTKNEFGSFDVGYKRFRTFYDGIGGFFPVNNSWRQLSKSELHTDRAKFWAKIKIEKPNQPSFELSYVNDLRDGRKDTTIWGDTDFTGIPNWTTQPTNPISSNRKAVPSYIDLNERQETLTALLKHTVGSTSLEIEIANNRTNSLDTRWLNRYPGELKPYPSVTTTSAAPTPPERVGNPNFGYDQQFSKADVWTYAGKFETKLSDMAELYGGLSYQRANADIAGDREIALIANSGAGVLNIIGGFGSFSTRPPYSYKSDGTGRTEENVFTGNLGLSLNPAKDLRLTFAFKGENLDMTGHNQVTYLNNLIVQSTGVITPVNFGAPNVSTRNGKSWVPEFTFRYTGIKDVSFYGTFDYRYSPGQESGSSTGVTIPTTFNGTVLPSVVSSDDNVKLNHGHYKTGVNWTVSRAVSLRGEIFFKDHTNKYSDVAGTGGYLLGYEFHGVKLTGIFTPMPELTFTTRYVGQSGKMHTIIDGANRFDTMDSKNHLFGETIDWNPSKQVYAQANLNVVFSTMSSVYPRAGFTATGQSGNDVLHNADNNYVNGSLVTGFVVAKDTDAQLQYTFYRADNYNPALIVTLPYGASVRENVVSLALKHKFAENLIGNVKLGYFESVNDTTGGNTNFKGPMGYVSLEYRL